MFFCYIFFAGGWGGRGVDFLQILYLYVTTYYKYDMLVCVCVCVLCMGGRYDPITYSEKTMETS